MLPQLMISSVPTTEDLLIDIVTLPANVLSESSNIALPLEPMDYIEDLIADMVTFYAMALVHSLKTLLPLKSMRKVLPIDDASAASRKIMEKATPSALVLAQVLLSVACLERVESTKDLLGDSANLLASVWTQLLQLMVPLQLAEPDPDEPEEDTGVSGVVSMVLHIVRLEVVESLSECLLDSTSTPTIQMVESMLPLVQAQLIDTMPHLFLDMPTLPGMVVL